MTWNLLIGSASISSSTKNCQLQPHTSFRPTFKLACKFRYHSSSVFNTVQFKCQNVTKGRWRRLPVFEEVFYSRQNRRAELLLVVNRFLLTNWVLRRGEYESEPRFGFKLDWIARAKISEGLPLTPKKNIDIVIYQKTWDRKGAKT